MRPLFFINHSIDKKSFTSINYGKVTSKDLNNRAIYYSYNVDGIKYDVVRSGDRGNPGINIIDIGQDVVVFYDPENPHKSFLGYPQMSISHQNETVFLITVVFPMFPMIIGIALYLIIKKIVIKQ